MFLFLSKRRKRTKTNCCALRLYLFCQCSLLSWIRLAFLSRLQKVIANSSRGSTTGFKGKVSVLFSTISAKILCIISSLFINSPLIHGKQWFFYNKTIAVNSWARMRVAKPTTKIWNPVVLVGVIMFTSEFSHKCGRSSLMLLSRADHISISLFS